MPAASGKHRVIYPITGFILMLFLGLVYAWSIFIKPLEAEFGWLRSQTSLTFTLSMIFFCVGNLAAGVINKRTSPRTSIVISAVIAGVGLIAASFTSSLLWIYISYGVFCGFAVGLGANAVMTMVLKWYPDKQGFISGIELTGVGFGSLLLGPFVSLILTNFGWRSTFMSLGIAFAVLLALGALILHEPSDEYVQPLLEKARKKKTVAGGDYSTGTMLKTSSFWFFMLWIVLIGAGGLALISNAVPAAQDLLSSTMDTQAALLIATTAMGMLSAFNGVGRLGIGFLWDKKGYHASLIVISILYLCSMIFLIIATKISNFPLLVIGFVVLGMAYGGSMCSNSAIIGSFFGTKNYSMNYACASCNLMAAAAIGPTVVSAFKVSAGSYGPSYLVFLIFAVFATIVSFMIKDPAKRATNGDGKQ